VTLSQQQFGDKTGSIWDAHTDEMRASAKEYPAEGKMPITEMKQRMDPVFRSWSHFTSTEHGYISNLADHVKREGVIEPVILTEHGMIYDGHHRTAAAEMAGETEVPWRRIKREQPGSRGGDTGPGLP
jgi:hypothetical protein